jgi:predicted RND superfamily exporter protein
VLVVFSPSPADPVVFALAVGALLASGLWIATRRPEWVLRAPRTVLAMLLGISLCAASALVRLDPPGVRLAIDPSTEPLIPAGDPAHEDYRRVIGDFGDDQVYVIAMEAEDVFTAEHLHALRRVSDRVSRLQGVRDVKSLVKVTSFGYAHDSGSIEVRPLIEDVPDDREALVALRTRATRDPLYRATLVSADARAAALNVRFRRMTDREFIAADLDGRIRRIVDEESGGGRRFYLSGRPHIKSVMYHAMTRDLTLLIPGTFAVIALALLVLAGSLRALLLPLATVAVSILWTFGAMAWLERPLTVLSVLLAPTLLAIGGVYGVHVVNRYDEEAPVQTTRLGAARATLEGMIVPVLVAGLTTAVGFAALTVSDVPAVVEIGAFSVLGVGSVTLLALTGVPAILALLPLRARPPTRLAARAGAVLDRGLLALADRACTRPGLVVGIWMLLVLGAGLSIPRIAVDTDYLTFFDPDAPVRWEFERINHLLAGAVPIFVVLEGRPGVLREPALLRRIEAIQARIDAIPGVSRSLSLLDPLRVLNRAVSADDPAEERVPDTRGAVTELLFMLPKADLQRFATIDHSSANLIVRTGAVGSAALRDLTANLEAALTDLPPELSATVTGNAILLTRAADGVANAQPRTVGLAALAIFALLAGVLRSAWIGGVAMIPNVVPVVLFFGILGAGVAPLSLPTSLIGSVALGIAVDATAHYLVRYREVRASGHGPEEAVRFCNRHVGRPIAIGSLMLMLGFGAVMASGFATLREFGLLSSVTMGICALTDLLLLPAILVRFRI